MAVSRKGRNLAPTFKVVEINYVRVGSEEFEQLLDECAEIVYRSFCQLPEKKTLVSETLTPLAADGTGTNVR